MKRSKNTTIGPCQKNRYIFRTRRHHLEEAERFFAPASIIENPDWLVGAE